jgi:hypothetical protein
MMVWKKPFDSPELSCLGLALCSRFVLSPEVTAAAAAEAFLPAAAAAPVSPEVAAAAGAEAFFEADEAAAAAAAPPFDHCTSQRFWNHSIDGFICHIYDVFI